MGSPHDIPIDIGLYYPMSPKKHFHSKYDWDIFFVLGIPFIFRGSFIFFLLYKCTFVKTDCFFSMYENKLEYGGGVLICINHWTIGQSISKTVYISKSMLFLKHTTDINSSLKFYFISVTA